MVNCRTERKVLFVTALIPLEAGFAGPAETLPAPRAVKTGPFIMPVWAQGITCKDDCPRARISDSGVLMDILKLLPAEKAAVLSKAIKKEAVFPAAMVCAVL
jgi:hypothetical protein